MDKKYYVLIILIIIGAVYLNRNHQTVEFINKNIQFNYTSIETGKVFYYSKNMNNKTVKDILNDYITELKEKNINYGDPNDNIFNKLEVVDTFNQDGNLKITFNEEFYRFNDVLTKPGYFIQGVHDILAQIKFVNNFSIEIENHKDLELIHPDGVMLKNLDIIRSRD